MVEETQFSIISDFFCPVSQCCHVQKGWPRVLTARALPSKTWICLQIDKRLARLVEHVRFARAQAEVLKIPRFGSPKLIAFRKSVRSAAGDNRILTKRGVENFLGKDLGSVFGSLWNSAGWDPFWAKELVILPAYGVHLGKLRRLEKENSSLRTWVWRLGKVSMAGQPPQPLLPLEIKALWSSEGLIHHWFAFIRPAINPLFLGGFTLGGGRLFQPWLWPW